MTDILIRGVPDDVIAALDSRAGRLGLSRSEYLRRRLAPDPIDDPQRVTAGDLSFFAEVFSDLTDPTVMKGAWS